jgi:hypothetical protein
MRHKFIILIFLLFFLLYIGNLNASIDKEFNYQSSSYNIKPNGRVDEISQLSYINEKALNCTMIYGGASYYEEYFQNINPSDISVRINGRKLNFIGKDKFFGNSGSVDEAYTLVDVCDKQFLNSYPENNSIGKELNYYCINGKIISTSLYIESDIESSLCNYEISINDVSVNNSITGNFFLKNFKTGFLPIRNSSHVIIEVTIPDEYFIVNNSLEEYVIKKDTNYIKWDFNSGADNFKQFSLDYKLSYIKWLRNSLDNDYIVFVLFLLSLLGIFLSIYELIGLYKKYKKHIFSIFKPLSN